MRLVAKCRTVAYLSSYFVVTMCCLLRKRAADGTSFGKTLKDFGYRFDEEGKLVDDKTGAGFVFEYRKGDHPFNQQRYEALGDVIANHIYELLEAAGLKKVTVPIDLEEGEGAGFFFATPDVLEWSARTVLILIHGSGAVRAGQWSRRLIMNDCLDSGTQLPYIRKAQARGFGIIVLNCNQNTDPDGGPVARKRPIRGSEDPLDHAIYVWDKFVSRSAIKHIAIVAHSAGGYVTQKLARNEGDDFVQRVFAVCFTDSAHTASSSVGSSWKHIIKVGRNWVTSSKLLDKELPTTGNDVMRVAAGTTVHEETSHTAIDSVWTFIDERLQ